jgi:hypothetical protein
VLDGVSCLHVPNVITDSLSDKNFDLTQLATVFLLPKLHFQYALSFVLITATLARAQLQISAVVDATLPGALPKAVELVVCSDISDLSMYGLESANNGGGAQKVEFTFPSGSSASAGDFIYVASERAQFEAFFGFAPTFTSSSALSINGDDAIVLYKNGAIIDVFGEPDVDGTGQPWEYADGWAARINQKASSVTFDVNDWTFSGPDALDGVTTNAASATPVPVKRNTCGDSAVVSDPVVTDPVVTDPVVSDPVVTIMAVQGR